jgi:rifampicin phosphotransferase
VNVSIQFPDVGDEHRALVGGKGFSLSVMAREGLPVPPGVCLTTEAYRRYVEDTGLRVKIIRELNRKRFKDMRWEEMWDTALRIRNLFLRTPIPEDLAFTLKQELSALAGERAVVVRSSAPGEDSSKTSFAGLHESYLNIRGMDALLEHIRLVWASLWSDAALLYRRELGLDVEKSAMAVVVQEVIPGDRSGVAFGVNPNDMAQSVIEAVHGLNEGLVSGQVEPDRWILERASGRIVSHTAPLRDRFVVPAAEGVRIDPLPPDRVQLPPLTGAEVLDVHRMVLLGETIFGAPQDMEWTYEGERLFLLQSRPITTVDETGTGDERPWYLSLRRTFENLKSLRRRVEEEVIPEMLGEADRLAADNILSLPDDDLVHQIEERARIYTKWKAVYWNDFIPLAHGVRLFGVVYNDAIRPDDPYEFMNLLGATAMVSLERNRALEELASPIRDDATLRESVGRGVVPESFREKLDAFITRFGEMFESAPGSVGHGEQLIPFILEMAGREPVSERKAGADMHMQEEVFFARFTDEKRKEAEEILDLGRASYKLRDNDNIYLGRVKAQLVRALEELERRRTRGTPAPLPTTWPEDVASAIEEAVGEGTPTAADREGEGFSMRARQIVGQPAGPGLGTGPARIVTSAKDALQFKRGEVMVCDAIDPTMTFVVPLAAAIVERRGGMLIHGSIIAREYGIPCVTGVPDATRLIGTGDVVTVDGYLGIVIIERGGI